MKLNKLFVPALAALAFVACNKDNENGVPAPQEGTGLSVTVSILSTGTRAVEDGFTADQSNITLTAAKIYFADGANGNIVDARDLAVGDLETPQVFHNVNPSATHAIVAANYGSLLASTPATVAALKATELDLSTVQDLAQVPLMSTASPLVENDGEHPLPEDGSETDAEVTYRKVSLTLTPVLARIEIGGTLAIKSTLTEGKFIYKNFISKNVGLNGLYAKCTLDGTASVGDPVQSSSNVDGFPTTSTPAWMYDAFQGGDSADLILDEDNSIALTKVYAYNVMPGDKPEITLQFDSTPINIDELPEGAPLPVSPKAYLKIVNFSKSGATQTLTAGNVYKISAIEFDQEKVTLLDDQVLCVEVSVTVEPWKVNDVEPEFGE